MSWQERNNEGEPCILMHREEGNQESQQRRQAMAAPTLQFLQLRSKMLVNGAMLLFIYTSKFYLYKVLFFDPDFFCQGVLSHMKNRA
jgi:hypothetical protein